MFTQIFGDLRDKKPPPPALLREAITSDICCCWNVILVAEGLRAGGGGDAVPRLILHKKILHVTTYQNIIKEKRNLKKKKRGQFEIKGSSAIVRKRTTPSG